MTTAAKKVFKYLSHRDKGFKSFVTWRLLDLTPYYYKPKGTIAIMTRKCTERKPLQIGQKFGKLTVIGLDHIEKRIRKNGTLRHRYMYKCQCDCGNTHIAYKGLLLSGNIKSCGCLQHEEEYRKVNSERQKTHGMTNTLLYKCWNSMKNRCNNPKMKNYSVYGGRGISYCKEWEHFEPFMDWALKNGYKEKLSIDRIDVNGNYEPSNCRWVALKQQARNRRDTYFITYNGETHCLTEWAEILGFKRVTLQKRIKDYRWSIKKAFTTSIKNGEFTYKGQTKNTTEWAKEYGLTRGCLESRLNDYGWSIEKALTTPVKKRGV